MVCKQSFLNIPLVFVILRNEFEVFRGSFRVPLCTNLKYLEAAGCLPGTNLRFLEQLGACTSVLGPRKAPALSGWCCATVVASWGMPSKNMQKLGKPGDTWCLWEARVLVSLGFEGFKSKKKYVFWTPRSEVFRGNRQGDDRWRTKCDLTNRGPQLWLERRWESTRVCVCLYIISHIYIYIL